jgi:predicted MFS family arabinose efflux permease
VVTPLATRFGWVRALAIVAAVLSAAAFLSLLLLPSLPAPRNDHHESGRPPFWSLLLRPMVLTSVLVELLATPLGSSAYVHVGPYADSLGGGLAVATGAAAMTVAGNAFGRIAGGAASDRAGVTPVLVVVLIGTLACALLLAVAPGAPLLLAAAFLAGLGFGAPNGVMPRLAAEVAPEAPNTAFGLIFTGFATGSFSGPLIGELAGNTARGWTVMAAFPAGCLLVLAVRRALYSGR